MAAAANGEVRALALWERAVGMDRWGRGDALLGAIGTVPEALGPRNAALIALRSELFGRDWRLRSRCPECGSEIEFAPDSAALAAELKRMAAEPSTVSVDWQGRSLELRAPTSQDLAAISHHADRDAAARALLARCIEGAIDTDELDEAAVEELGARIEALDPGAVVSFRVSCPDCTHGWSAPVDVGEAFWSELQLLAERVLTEVDALARAYGWTEDAVLRLSPMRRAAYLQLVGAA